VAQTAECVSRRGIFVALQWVECCPQPFACDAIDVEPFAFDADIELGNDACEVVDRVEDLGDNGDFAQACGVAIRDEIEERTGRRVTLGAVYTTLLRLENKRLVATRLGEPTPQRGGRRKKFYRPLAAGRRELAASIEAVRSMTRGLTPTLELLP
jgi:hypothetical protein